MEGAEDDEEQGIRDVQEIGLSAKDVLCGIAASGRTPYVIAAMRYAQSIGAYTIAVTCNAEAEMSKVADCPISAVVCDLSFAWRCVRAHVLSPDAPFVLLLTAFLVRVTNRPRGVVVTRARACTHVSTHTHARSHQLHTLLRCAEAYADARIMCILTPAPAQAARRH